MVSLKKHLFFSIQSGKDSIFYSAKNCIKTILLYSFGSYLIKSDDTIRTVCSNICSVRLLLNTIYCSYL